jgi:hypothetical protein
MPRLYSKFDGGGMNDHEHCTLCPIKAGSYCRGEQVKRFCELIDPAHTRHDPKYIKTIHKQSAEWEARQLGTYPTLAQQARNLWRDIKSFVRSGGKLAPKALRMARLAVCEVCDKWDKQQRRCRACGCKMDAKTYSLAAKCPLDLWPKQENIDS